MDSSSNMAISKEELPRAGDVKESPSIHQLEDVPNQPNTGGTPARLNIQTILAFVSLCGQFNAYVMTLQIPSTTLAYINADLGPDPNYVWITVSWQLGACILVSVGGRLSDIFGRRYFMITGSVLGIVGCVVGATGQSINQMIASGAVLGLASGFQEMSYACVQEILPNKWRMAGVGIFDVSLIIAYMGPIISYAFIAAYPQGWRYAYWYMFAWHVMMFVVLFFFYKPPDFYMKHRTDGKTKWQLLKEIDYIGILLFSAGATLFLLGVNFGGRLYPWQSAGVIAPIVVGFLCFIALGFWETMPHLKYPLLPPKLFRKVREFVMVITICFTGGMLYYSMSVLWPRESAAFFIPADQTLLRGAYAMVFPMGNFLGGILMATVMPLIHHEKWQLVGFMCGQTALIGSLASIGIYDKAQAIATVFFAACFVTAAQLLTFTMLSLGLDDQTDIGVAVGLAGTFRLLGGAVATTIYTAVLNGQFNTVLPGEIDKIVSQTGFPKANESALLTAAISNTAAAYQKVPGINSAVIAGAQLAVKLSNVQAFKLVYLVALAFGGLSIIAAFCTVSTDRRKKTYERAVVLRNEIQAQPEKTGPENAV